MKPFKKNPEIGDWYRHLDKGHEFQVVAYDPDEGSVEIQYFDGDVEEIDLDTWRGLDIEPIAEPESWSGPLDIGELDDLGTEITDTEPADWLEPETARGGEEGATGALEFGGMEPEEEEEEEEEPGAADKPWES